MIFQKEILNWHAQALRPLACLFSNLMPLHKEKLYNIGCSEHKILPTLTRAEN